MSIFFSAKSIVSFDMSINSAWEFCFKFSLTFGIVNLLNFTHSKKKMCIDVAL